MGLGRGRPLGKDLGLLVLQCILALSELVHDVGDLLLQTEVVALVELVEKRLAASSDGEIGERWRSTHCESKGSAWDQACLAGKRLTRTTRVSRCHALPPLGTEFDTGHSENILHEGCAGRLKEFVQGEHRCRWLLRLRLKKVQLLISL